MNFDMMKQKFFLLIGCLLFCVAVWSQEDSQSWSIENFKVTSVTDKNEKVVYIESENTYNLPVNAEEVRVEFEFILKKEILANEVALPQYIWCSSDGNAVQSFEADYVPVGDEGNLWSVSKTIEIAIPNNSADLSLSLGFSEDNLEYRADELIRVWSQPDAPSLSPNKIETFTGETYMFNVVENAVPDVFSSRYFVNGSDVSAEKQFNATSPNDIGNQEYEETSMTLGYSYSFGDKVWFENTNTIAAQLITYHRPVYKCVVKVNNIERDGQEATVTHSDDIELIVRKEEFGYGEVYSSIWNGKGESYIAQNTGDSNVQENSEVTMTNRISDDIADSQSFSFSIIVLPEIKVERTIPEETYSFIPEGDTKIAVQRIHNQDDLVWIWNWMFEGNEISESDNNEIVLSAEMLKNPKDYQLIATVSCYNKNDNNKYYLDNENITYTIHVVDSPKVKSFGNSDQDNIITCHGQKFNIDITTEGGYESEYHFNLYSDGKEYGSSDKSEGTSYTISYYNQTGAIVSSDFTLKGHNNIPAVVSTTGLEQTRNVTGADKIFHATIYPYPQVQFNDELNNYFYGSSLNKTLVNKYQMPDTGNEWKFTWTFDDAVLDSFEDKYDFNIDVPNGVDSERTTHKLVVNAKNYYNGTLWAEQDLSFDITAWHRPQFDGIVLTHEGTSNPNVYEGHTFSLDALTQYGYPEGWTYIWKLNDNILSSNKNEVFEAEMLGTDGNENQTYELHVENKIPGLTEPFDFTSDQAIAITVWRKAENFNSHADASVITITDIENGANVNNRIREGRELRLQVPQAQYGYQNDWTYTWNGNDTKSPQTQLSVSKIQASGESMAKELRTVSLKISNIGPNGQAWEENTVTKQYTVYREPKTPTALAKKGNGFSRTLIATTEIEDQQLMDNDYYLCFGLQESNGDVTIIGEPQKQNGAGQTRFSTQVPQDLWSDTDKLCVFALWHYDDGTWVSSGLRFINAVNEDWDGSDYNGNGTYSGITRGGEATEIQEVKIENEHIRSIYGLDGSLLENMQRGLNVVRMTDGSVKKILVK